MEKLSHRKPEDLRRARVESDDARRATDFDAEAAKQEEPCGIALGEGQTGVGISSGLPWR